MYEVVRRLDDLFQVAPEAEAEVPHAQPEHQPDGQEEARRDVPCLVVERRGMRIGIEDGQVVQFGQHTRVAAVREFLDECFHLFVDGLHVAVGHVAEEDAHVVGRHEQLCLCQVIRAGLAQLAEAPGHCGVVRVVDDDFLAEDVAVRAQPKQLAEERDVELEVEDDGVLVGLVGQESADGRKDHRADPHAVPDVPAAVARQLHARRVENIVEDEDYHGDDGRHSESALADDGSQRRTDEKENQTTEREGDFLCQSASCFRILLSASVV